MPLLNNNTLGSTHSEGLPVKVLQFGGGSFLRGFLDWMVDEMNRKGLFEGRVSVVQSTSGKTVELLQSQDHLYTLLLRGIEAGEVTVNKSVISSIARGVSAESEFEKVLLEAENPELRIIVSNTTESGIVLDLGDSSTAEPPRSFPGKLLRVMRHRYESFSGDRGKGFLVFPCELIEENGEVLKKILVELTQAWYPGDEEFKTWLVEANVFFNTLVDRIVSGYPKGEDQKIFGELGYEDYLLNAGEIFHFFAIEGPEEYQKEFPLVDAGFNVKWCDDISPYRIRKVRILNGAHTMTVLGAHLMGLTTVKECMDDPLVVKYLEKGLFEEILPTMDLPEDELKEFAGAVIDRFRNPYLEHFLLSISLNSVSKWKTRILPTFLDVLERTGRLPKILTFSLVALVLFYRGKKEDGRLQGVRACDGKPYEIQDSFEVLEYFEEQWKSIDVQDESSLENLMKNVLGQVEFWGRDLGEIPGLLQLSSQQLREMMTSSVRDAMEGVVKA